VEKVISALKEQKIGEQNFNYDYSIVYSTPWAPHVDIEERHYRNSSNKTQNAKKFKE
jgi:hypothetical protein